MAFIGVKNAKAVVLSIIVLISLHHASAAQSMGRRAGKDDLIVGGTAVNTDRYPYSAIIFTADRPYCSGALIHPQVVITAAHCTESPYFAVKIGTRNWLLDDVYGRTYYAKRIAKAIPHPDFRKNANRGFADMIGDLALLVLTSPVPDNYTTIKLPKTTTTVPSKLQVIGYGTTSEFGDKMSNVLRSVSVDSVDRKLCNRLLNKVQPSGYSLTDGTICAGVLSGGKDSCQGDSGGPLFIQGKNATDDTLVGLVSFGEGCARKNIPAGYTNMMKYVPWIEGELAKLVKAQTIKDVKTIGGPTGGNARSHHNRN